MTAMATGATGTATGTAAGTATEAAPGTVAGARKGGTLPGAGTGPAGQAASGAAAADAALAANRAAARDSLRGLALGDAFGECWYPIFELGGSAYEEIRARSVPVTRVWHWTDDTAMALSVLRVLDGQGEIDQQRLARAFGKAFMAEPGRGYGAGMHDLLPRLAGAPAAWETDTPALAQGQGSRDSGAAMRVAPLGAWFSDDVARAAEQAALSARVTHTHPDGVAGAVAVAVAAALAVRLRRITVPRPAELLRMIAARTPRSAVKEGLLHAAELPEDAGPRQAAEALGNGTRGRADDTVPYALWCAAHHLRDLPEALWATVEGQGRADTTCAIAGGVVAARVGLGGVPPAWLTRCEPLPDWVGANPPTTDPPPPSRPHPRRSRG
ncbi:ADP-ribosylglycohydrolase family protein [Streptomyces pathocidini]|uniref:ADP-ribosylglycohydrolase family protein n=1 Tax=Streptomyces pathocidini TaxID=1650571 RepID=UPI0033F0BC51